MPIYEYTCKECSSVFEIFLRSRDDRVACPSCSSDRVTKLFSTFAMQAGGSDTLTNNSGSSCSSCSGGDCSTCH